MSSEGEKESERERERDFVAIDFVVTMVIERLRVITVPCGCVCVWRVWRVWCVLTRVNEPMAGERGSQLERMASWRQHTFRTGCCWLVLVVF